MNESLDQKIRHRNAVARAHSQATRGQTSMLMVKEAPVYSGRSLEIIPIALANLILTFLTVGIYRFWAKTRIRRYFVSRVSFLRDPLEYSGTGMELFIGFLIVLAVLVPFFFVTGILQNFLTQPGTDPLSAVIFQIAYLLLFYFLYNAAVYRAQRYRLSRISWRGIRGGQEGSALLYAACAIGLGLLTLITFGLAYPIMRRILVGYRINRTCFGTTRLTFHGGFAKLIGAWLAVWLAGLALFAFMSYLVWIEVSPAIGESASPALIERSILSTLGRHKALLATAAAFIPVAFIWYRMVETRQWINGTRFDQLHFASRLNLLHILLPYTAYLLLLATFVGVAIYGFTHLVDLTGSRISPAIPVETPIILAVAAVAVVWLLGGLLQPVIVQNWLLNNICRTLTIQGRFSPDTLFQNQLAIPRSGEGLADALDVDAF